MTVTVLRSAGATETMVPMNSSVEHVLEGGNVAEAVVRVGSTMRKPATDSTAAVEALLDHFVEVGSSGAPSSLGRDELGRHVLEVRPRGDGLRSCAAHSERTTPAR